MSLYLYCPVLVQLRLLLQLLLQVAVSLCLLGPDRGGSEATVITCWVTFVQGGTLLGVHSYQDHTCGERRRMMGKWKVSNEDEPCERKNESTKMQESGTPLTAS